MRQRVFLLLALLFVTVLGSWAQSIIHLSSVSGDITVENGTTLTGTCTDKLITIAAGATVTLKGVNISHSKNYGIDCLGDATIILADGTTNTLSAGGSQSTLHVKYNSTLTIQGKGTLNVTNTGSSAAIGSSYNSSHWGCGNIVINDGTITARGGDHAAAIGAANRSSSGNVVINGGTVFATGGTNAAAIGTGDDDSNCNSITIGPCCRVQANAGEGGYAHIGRGDIHGSSDICICGTISINGSETEDIRTGGGTFSYNYPVVYDQVTNESSLRSAMSKADYSHIITLANDITVNNHLEVATGRSMTIDLNGHRLKRFIKDKDDIAVGDWSEYFSDGHVIWIRGGSLVIIDSSGNDSGSIEGGEAFNGGGINVGANDAKTIFGYLRLEGGTIRNNKGVIDWNLEKFGFGGGIYVRSGCSLTVTGGVVSGNTAEYRGGGIYVGEDANVNICGGTITGNNVVTNASVAAYYPNKRQADTGGGIYSESTLNMQG